MLDLEEAHLEVIKTILSRHIPNLEVRAFGSRVNGNNRRYSDLDLAVMTEKELDWEIKSALEEAFAVSDLPIIVDIVDWATIDERFQNIVNQFYVVIQKP